VKKSEVYGLTGSIIITGILILLLFLIVMPGLKQPEDEGIMVSFGEVDMGAGNTQTPTTEPVIKETTPPPAAPKPVKQEVLTQDDNSLAIAEQKKKDKREKEAAERLRIEEQRIANEKKKAQQDAINKANEMNGLFGNSNSKGSGTTSGDGRQGNPAGSGNSGGNSWSLNGRIGEGKISEPTDIFQEGTVKVSIIVDSNGKVISAKATGGNISDLKTKQLVEAAAYKSKFPPGEGEARGTITYNLRYSNK